MGAVLSTAVALAAVCTILMRLCSLPATKVCRPKRRVLIKLWEGFCSFLTKVHGTARKAYLVPLHVNEIVLAMRLCLRPQVKIAWSFYQVATLIPVVYLVQLPTQVEEVLDLFRISIELEAYNIHISCYGASGIDGQIGFLVIWPIIGICTSPLIGLALSLLFKQTTLRELCALRHQRGSPSFTDTVLLGYAMPLTMLILYFAFPPVTALTFRLFEDCTTFTDELGESQAFLISDRKHYAVPCPSDELKGAQSTAWLAIFLYPVGVILLSAWLLYLGRSTLLLEQESTPYTRSISFLHAPFKPTYFYFDLLELAKKLFLIGFASLIEPGTLAQITVAVIVSLLFLVLHLQSLPYRRNMDNILATMVNLSLVLFSSGRRSCRPARWVGMTTLRRTVCRAWATRSRS